MIDLQNVYKIYQVGDSTVHALDGMSLHIDDGEFVAIVGQSGSGKSTLMNIIGCLDIPTMGKYILDNIDVSTLSDDELSYIRKYKLGFIFQQYNLIQKLNVISNVELPLIYKRISKHERTIRAKEALQRVGLEGKEGRYPQQLSGGQQQRVSIARALATKPSVILADEPTGALDSKTGAEVLELIKKLDEEGNTIILVTHDNGIAAQAKRIVRIQDGKIIEDSNNKNS